MDDATRARARRGGPARRLHHRRERHRARPDRRAERGARPAGARPRREARRQRLRGPPHRAHLQPAGPRRAVRARSRCTQNVLPVVEGVLDPGCLVSSLSSIAIDPGETAQPIHADDQVIPLAKPHAPIVCNTMWALTDFTEANGATRLVPGSHLRHNPDYGGAYDTIAGRDAEGQRAGLARRALARRRGQPHRRAAHRHRHELLRRLHPPAGEPAARHPAPSWRSSFSPRLQELVGYGVYSGLIGHIDKQSPAQRLNGRRRFPLDLGRLLGRLARTAPRVSSKRSSMARHERRSVSAWYSKPGRPSAPASGLVKLWPAPP